MAHFAKQRKYIWALPVLVIVIALFILFKPDQGSSTVSRAENKTNAVQVIRIAVPDLSSSDRPSSGSAVIDHLYLNQLLEKEFEKDNIRIDWQFFKGAGPVINEALVNKQLDFAFLGDLAAIIGKSNQIDTKLLIATVRDVHGYLAVQSGQGYKNIHDLKGKRIAVWQGTASQLSFNQILNHYGLTEKDFRIVNLDPPAMNAALVAKQIDGGWGSLGVLALQQRGLIDIVATSRESNSTAGTTQSGLIGVSGFIQEHPEIVQRLINTVLKSSYWVSQPENREAAIKQVVENANYPYELYAEGFKNQEFRTIYSPHLDTQYVNHFKQGVKTALAVQLIRQDFDVDAWIDDQFVHRGIQQLGYQNVW